MDNQPLDSVIQPSGVKVRLPNSTETLVLGICSLPCCCCFGFIGMTAGILAIVLGNGALKTYKANPELYTKASYDNANAGYICGIIGTIISALYTIYLVIYFIVLIFYGITLSGWPSPRW